MKGDLLGKHIMTHYIDDIPMVIDLERKATMVEPKFKVGDKVKFILNGETVVGEVAIVDRYGTFMQTEEPSYDILAMWNGEKTLIKHVRQRGVAAAE